MTAAKPGSKIRVELGELASVDAVLLQVGQTGIVALRRPAAGAPVAARHVFGLDSNEAPLHSPPAWFRPASTVHSGLTSLPASQGHHAHAPLSCHSHDLGIFQ